MPIVKINNGYLIIFIQGVKLGGWLDPALPDFIRAKVQMLAAVHSHEDYIILLILVSLRILPSPVWQLVLTGLTFKHSVEIIVQFRAWTIQVNENSQLLLVVQQVVDLLLCFKIDD